MKSLGTSASSWSTKKPVTLVLVVAACLVLSSPGWIFQATATSTMQSIHTVDPTWGTGSYVSLALDSKGYAGISYYDANNTHLKYAHWTDNWNVQTVDSDDFNGLHTSVAFDSKDHPHISYMAQNGLKHAYWNGSTWNIEFIDVAGSFTSIAIDANDYPRISYFSIQNGADLKYAAYNGTAWNIETVDSQGFTGEFTSLKLDSNGYAHISYLDITNRDLKIAWQDNEGWYTQVVDSAGDVGWYSSLALDANGTTHISYFNNASRDLKYARSLGSNWSIQTIESNGDVGTDTSIALDSNGNPHISYTDTTNHVLKYTSWNGSQWIIQALPYAGFVGEYTSLPNDQTSLQIDMNDTAHIAYCDWGSYCLKYITAPNSVGTVKRFIQPMAMLTITPHPFAVGQTVNITVTLTPKPPTTFERFEGIILTVRNPDGTSCFTGPFFSNSSGIVTTQYCLVMVGNMTFQAKYYGQLFQSNNATYLPTESNVITLQVQQNLDPTPAPTTSPTPTPTSTVMPTTSPTPTPTPTTTSKQPSQISQQSYNDPWQSSQPYNQDTNQPDGTGSTKPQRANVYHDPGPFPTVETAVASVVAFSVTVGVILFLKRWE
jgi:hypothetical protein